MIVSCGEALVDLVPGPVPGGGPMNVAVAAARQGGSVAFAGRVSTDRHGETIWSHLVANGVDLRLCQRGPEPTARAIVEHVPELRFRFEGERTADTRLDALEVAELGSGPHILHGGTLGMFRGRTAEVLLDAARNHDGIVSLDPNVRPEIIDDRRTWDRFHDGWLEHTDLYRGSDEDLAWIWPDLAIGNAAARLLERGVSVVMVTRGGASVEVYRPAGRVDVPAIEVDVVDTVGAGDTFIATVLVQLHQLGLAGSPSALTDLDDATWIHIVERAIRAAAITCSRPGADPPWKHELERSDKRQLKGCPGPMPRS